jgi:hypothetical protein
MHMIKKFWYPRTDLNRHSLRNRILSPARLPIPPRGHSLKRWPHVEESNPYSRFRRPLSYPLNERE